MNQRILITGASGQMGLSFKRISQEYPTIDFTFLNKSEFDLRNNTQMQTACEHIRPAFIINCAAYTAVDKAEENTQMADWINHVGVADLAEISNKLNIYLIHFSTDYVYHNGLDRPLNETDPTTPHSVYGSTKLKGEKAIVANTNKYLILRTSWIFGEFRSNFLKTMLRLMSKKIDLRVVDDQIGTPSYSVDLARSVMSIITKNELNDKRSGIYNLSNKGQCSWFDLAIAIQKKACFTGKIEAVTSAEYPTLAQRPNYSVMNLSKIQNEFGIEFRAWEKGLNEAIDLVSNIN